eukprot:804757_1
MTRRLLLTRMCKTCSRSTLQQSPQKEDVFIMEVVNIINALITHQHGFSYELYKQVLVCAANTLTQCMLSTRQPVAEGAIAAFKDLSMQRLIDLCSNYAR